MCQEGHARIRQHTHQSRRKAAIEIHEAGTRRRCGCRERNRGRRFGGVLAVDLLTDIGQRGARVVLCLEGESDADYFQRVGDEDGGHAREGSAREAAQRRLVHWGGDQDVADLLVCEEFDGCVGEDSEEGCGVAAEEPAHAVLPVDVAHRGYDAEP